MRATLVVGVDGPVVRELAVEPPLGAKVRAGADGAVEVWLLSTGATLLEGDELTVRLRLRDGARVRARSVAAQLVHPCPGGQPATWRVEADVGEDAALSWWPEPTVVAAGGDFRACSAVVLADGARLEWCEELVLGRAAEPVADVHLTTELRVDGPAGPVLRDGLTSHPGWLGPAAIGGARYLGSRFACGHGGAPEGRDAPGPGWFALAGGGWATRVVAADVAAGRRRLEARGSIGCAPVAPSCAQWP